MWIDKDIEELDEGDGEVNIRLLGVGEEFGELDETKLEERNPKEEGEEKGIESKPEESAADKKKDLMSWNTGNVEMKRKQRSATNVCLGQWRQKARLSLSLSLSLSTS